MKNKLFSRGLYTEGLRQLKIVGIIFLAVLLLIGVSVPVIQYVNYLARVEMVDNPYMDLSPDVIKFDEMCAFVFFIALVAAPVFTFMLFSPFNRRSASDFYHSLPYKRTCMFFSFSAAVLTWVSLLTVISCGATIVAYSVFPQVFIVNLAGMGDALLTILAYALMLVFGIIAAMSLTGTPLANVTAAGLLLFLPRLLITIVTYAMSEIAPIIDGHFGIFGTDYNALVNLVYRLFSWGDFDTLTDNMASDIYSIFVAICYAALAAYLFTRRKSETAGHSAPGKLMHHIIRICVGLVISSIVTCAVVCGFEIEIAIVFYIVSIILYFAYELITQKTFKTIPSTLPGLAILAILNIAILGVGFGCAAYVHSYVPEADEVKAIYIENPTSEYYNSMSFNQYALEKAGQIRIEDKNAIKIATDALKINNEHSKKGDFYSYMYSYEEYKPDYENSYVDCAELHIVYVSNAGIKRTRNIYLPVDEYKDMMNLVQENEAYKEVFFEIPEAINRSFELRELYDWSSLELSDNDMEEIYQTIKAEINSLDFTTWATYLASGENRNGFEFSYMPKDADYILEFYFDGTILPKTTVLIMEKVNKAAGNELEVVYGILSDYAAAEERYESLYINMNAFNERKIWNLWFHHYDAYDSKSPKAEDDFITDLKALGEGTKSETISATKFIITRIEYEDYDGGDGVGDYNYHTVTVFIPYPADFEPQSDNFEIIPVLNEDFEITYKYEYID